MIDEKLASVDTEEDINESIDEYTNEETGESIDEYTDGEIDEYIDEEIDNSIGKEKHRFKKDPNRFSNGELEAKVTYLDKETALVKLKQKNEGQFTDFKSEKIRRFIDNKVTEYGIKNLVLDLYGVKAISSGAISYLLQLEGNFKSGKDTNFYLSRVNRNVREVIKSVNLDAHFKELTPYQEAVIIAGFRQLKLPFVTYSGLLRKYSR